MEKERAKLSGFYPEWAKPTYLLLSFLVIAFCVVIAFPYIPGSSSLAFKGVSVFVGLLFSLGSQSATNPYIRAAVNLDKAPNGAIANKKLLDGLEAFNWLKPTIENPAKGVWVYGGFGLAPMSIIEAKDGLITDTHISLHGPFMSVIAFRSNFRPEMLRVPLSTLRTLWVSRQFRCTCFGTAIACGRKNWKISTVIRWNW